MCNLSEGIEERGIEKGIKQGMEKGIEKGMAESRMEMAIELMKEKFPMEKISRITRLSMEKLQELGKMKGCFDNGVHERQNRTKNLWLFFVGEAAKLL